MADGSRHSLYAVKEPTYGVVASNPALDTVRITKVTLGLAKDSLQSNEIRKDRQIADFRLGANRVAGAIDFELSYGSFDAFLQSVLMSENWASDTPAPGTSQIKAGTLRSSWTFIREFADLTADRFFAYSGCELNQIDLTVSANAMITGTFAVVGKGMQILNDLTSYGVPTFNDISTTTPLDSFTGELKESGVVIAVITEIKLTLQNGIEPRFVVGQKDTIRPSVGRSNLTGSITAYFENSTLVKRFIEETESSIEFTLPDADGNSQKYIIPRIKYTGGQPDVEGEGPVMLTMPFQGLLDDTQLTNVVIQRTPAV